MMRVDIGQRDHRNPGRSRREAGRLSRVRIGLGLVSAYRLCPRTRRDDAWGEPG